MKKLGESVTGCDNSMNYYPNVAAEPTMYCPRVRSMPFGPGPKRTIFVAPKMKPMIRPTARRGQLEFCSARVGDSLEPIIAPIFPVIVSVLAHVRRDYYTDTCQKQ